MRIHLSTGFIGCVVAVLSSRSLNSDLVLHASQPTSSAAIYSKASLGIAPADYFGTLYCERPADDSPFLFFVGEPLSFRITFVNSGDLAETLALPDSPDARLVSISANRNGVRVPLGLRLSESGGGAATQKPLTLSSKGLTLGPGEQSTVVVDPEPSFDLPGIYIVEVSTALRDRGKRPVAPQSTRVVFEVRAVLSGDSAELTRRQGLRAFVNGKLDEADRSANELLKANPDSFAGLVLRGQVAQAKGETTAARAVYRQALEVLERSRDRQDRTPAGSLARKDSIEGLRNVIRALGGG